MLRQRIGSMIPMVDLTWMKPRFQGNTIVVGAQWGDEGKGKIVDVLAEYADVTVRPTGGCNAGHTLKRGNDVFKLHLIPSGILQPNKLCVIGNGTVIHPDVLQQEITGLTQRGISLANLKISDRAHVTLPLYTALDKAQEVARGNQKIGTTGRGIGPTYEAKVARTGLRVADLFEPEAVLSAKLAPVLRAANQRLSSLGQPEFTMDTVLADCKRFAAILKPYVADTVTLLNQAVAQNKEILFEGAQGTLLDVDFGTYPYVTSSNATAGGTLTGSGIGPSKIDRVLGVLKAYSTRVGEGPFPTELDIATDTVGKTMSEVGQERGTTTGRLRRCGWFDAVAGRFAVQVNGLTDVAITKLDVLDGLDEIKICTGYRNKATGAILQHVPTQVSQMAQLEPVYETMPGWKTPITEAKKLEDLPVNARRYLQRLSDLMGVPVSIISVGPEHSQTIILDNPLTSPKRQAAVRAIPLA